MRRDSHLCQKEQVLVNVRSRFARFIVDFLILMTIVVGVQEGDMLFDACAGG